MSLSSMTLFRSRSTPKLNGNFLNGITSSSSSSLASSSSSYGSWSRHSNNDSLGRSNKGIESSEFNQRACDLIDSLDHGLTECLEYCLDDIKSHKDQVKLSSAKDYSMRLRRQINFLLEMKKEFNDQLRMMSGVNTILGLRSSGSSSMTRSNSIKQLNDAKSIWKKCQSELLLTQTKLQSILGWWHLKVESIQGWARLCSRDVYEIIITHGNERHKTRVRIGGANGVTSSSCLRSNNPSSDHNVWQSRETILKVVDDDIEIRIREVKKSGLGSRHVTLGTKRISIQPLISGNPNLITFSGNASGSIKVTIRIEWRPFLDSVNKSLINIPRALNETTKIPKFNSDEDDNETRTSSRTSGTFSSGEHPTIKSPEIGLPRSEPGSRRGFASGTNSPSRNDFALENYSASKSEPGSRRDSGLKSAFEARYNPGIRNDGSRNNSILNSSVLSPMQISSPMHLVSSPLESSPKQASSPLKAPSPLQASSHGSTLLQGSIPGQATPERKDSLKLSTESVLTQLMSLLEDVQGQYEEIDELSEQVKRFHEIRDVEVDAALAEFGFLADEDDDPKELNDVQWDLAVETHLKDALFHLNYVGSWGLKSKERQAIHRLKQNADAIKTLLNFEVKMDLRIKNIWEIITQGDKKLVIPWKLALKSLIKMIEKEFNNEDDDIKLSSAESILYEMSPNRDYLTVLQFNSFWKSQQDDIQSVIENQILIYKLTRINNIQVNELHKILRIMNCKFKLLSSFQLSHLISNVASLLLKDNDPDVCRLARNWLRNVCDLYQDEVTSSLINGLESDSITIRLGCCRGLAFLKLNSAVEPLIHLSTDHSQDGKVREEARNCLWTFGHDAQSRYHHCALSTRGFSGIFVQ